MRRNLVILTTRRRPEALHSGCGPSEGREHCNMIGINLASEVQVMSPHEHRERIVAAYGDALHAFDDFYPLISDWDLPTPCGEWTLLDLSGHLLAIARYWHGL